MIQFRKISFEDAAKFPKGRRLEEDGLSGKVVAKFPPGVFDPAKKDSLEEIIGIQSRCGEADGTKITPEEILACVIYFTPVTGINQGTSEMPYALGTITLDTNLLDATFKGTYRANTVNGLFSPNASKSNYIIWQSSYCAYGTLFAYCYSSQTNLFPIDEVLACLCCKKRTRLLTLLCFYIHLLV